MVNLGNLKEVRDLREVWAHEALDFTPWLAEDANISLLADAVGLEITVDETESSIGDFKVDIFATETNTDRKIIIENQLEDTNHDHLGKLITYASGKSADLIIWIVKHAREEHRAAIEWLNNHTDDKIGFFLCEIKLYKIDDSQPAVKFEVLEKPNCWTKGNKQNNGINQQKAYDYWCAFKEYACKDSVFGREFKLREPQRKSNMDFSIGSSGYLMRICRIETRNEITLEFRIREDKSLFNFLYEYKSDIEKIAEYKFDWREQPEDKVSRILISKPVNLNDQSEWLDQFDWIIESLIKMKKAFLQYIEKEPAT